MNTNYKPQLFNDHFQNFKRYNIPKCQLLIADIPYNLGNNAYASNPSWYEGGDNDIEKVHPTQKPIKVLEYLIDIFTDKGDVIIDPCAGSGSTLRAAIQKERQAYGFEIKKDFYKLACEKTLKNIEQKLF